MNNDRFLERFVVVVSVFVVVAMGCIAWAMVKPVVFDMRNLQNIQRVLNTHGGRIEAVEAETRNLSRDLKNLDIEKEDKKKGGENES